MKRSYGVAVEARQTRPIKKSVRGSSLMRSKIKRKLLVNRTSTIIMSSPRSPPRVSQLSQPLPGCQITSCSGSRFPINETVNLIATERDIRLCKDHSWLPVIAGIRSIEKRDDTYRIEYSLSSFIEITATDVDTLDEILGPLITKNYNLDLIVQDGFREIQREIGGIKREMTCVKADIGDIKRDIAGIKGEMREMRAEFRSEIEKVKLESSSVITQQLRSIYTQVASSFEQPGQARRLELMKFVPEHNH